MLNMFFLCFVMGILNLHLVGARRDVDVFLPLRCNAWCTDRFVQWIPSQSFLDGLWEELIPCDDEPRCSKCSAACYINNPRKCAQFCEDYAGHNEVHDACLSGCSFTTTALESLQRSSANDQAPLDSRCIPPLLGLPDDGCVRECDAGTDCLEDYSLCCPTTCPTSSQTGTKCVPPPSLEYEKMPYRIDTLEVLPDSKKDIFHISWTFNEGSLTPRKTFFILEGHNSSTRYPNPKDFGKWVIKGTTGDKALVVETVPGWSWEFRLATVNKYGSRGFGKNTSPARLQRSPSAPSPPGDLGFHFIQAIRLGTGECTHFHLQLFWKESQSDIPVDFYWVRIIQVFQSAFVKDFNFTQFSANKICKDYVCQVTFMMPLKTAFNITVQALATWEKEGSLKGKAALLHVNVSYNCLFDNSTLPPTRSKPLPMPMWLQAQPLLTQPGAPPLYLLRWDYDYSTEIMTRLSKFYISWQKGVCLTNTAWIHNDSNRGKTTKSRSFNLTNLEFECRYSVTIQAINTQGERGEALMRVIDIFNCEYYHNGSSPCPQSESNLPRPVLLDSLFYRSHGKIYSKVWWEYDPPLSFTQASHAGDRIHYFVGIVSNKTGIIDRKNSVYKQKRFTTYLLLDAALRPYSKYQFLVCLEGSGSEHSVLYHRSADPRYSHWALLTLDTSEVSVSFDGVNYLSNLNDKIHLSDSAKVLADSTKVPSTPVTVMPHTNKLDSPLVTAEEPPSGTDSYWMSLVVVQNTSLKSAASSYLILLVLMTLTLAYERQFLLETLQPNFR